jgi:hypothetical protein
MAYYATDHRWIVVIFDTEAERDVFCIGNHIRPISLVDAAELLAANPDLIIRDYRKEAQC